MSITLKIDPAALDQLDQIPAAVAARITQDDVRLVIGRALQQVIKGHFEELANDSAHHRTATSLGADRTGLYEEASRAVQQPQLESDGVSVSINHVAIAQRLFGGTIDAKDGGFLTIPARTEAYGKRAKEFDNLRLIIFPSGAGALVERDATVAKGSRKGSEVGGGVYFWLVKQVTQRPDPSVLPTESEMLEPAMAAAGDYIDRVFQEAA